MKDAEKILVVAAVGFGAFYLWSRSGAIARSENPANYNPRFPNPTPQQPSPLGMNIGGGTNPITALVSGITSIFTRLANKQPGNASASPSTPASVGVQAIPNWIPPGANYIPPPPMQPSYAPRGSTPLVNLGDPNYAAYSYLSEPDYYFDAPPAVPSFESLAWTVRPEDSYIPPPPGMAS